MVSGQQISSYTSTGFTRIDEVGLYRAFYSVFAYSNNTLRKSGLRVSAEGRNRRSPTQPSECHRRRLHVQLCVARCWHAQPALCCRTLRGAAHHGNGCFGQASRRACVGR